jgi:hypothetical protein
VFIGAAVGAMNPSFAAQRIALLRNLFFGQEI